MTSDSLPRLSIGLPVYNGERFLRFALDAILNQTYRDFELIISDNASTDSTMRICQEYAARDSRVRYCRNLENVGSAENFNLVFAQARGQYFKWSAADDIISPTFLEKCIEVLDRDPSILLSYSRADRIDSSGEVDGSYDYPMRVSHPSAHVRFSDLILVNHFCIAVFGVVRREVLAKTPLIGKYVGSDRVLLAELGLRGRFYEVPEYLFHRRDHPQSSGRMFNIYNRLAWFDPSKRSQLNLVNWRVGMEYIHSINRVNLPLVEKMQCYQSTLRWFVMRRSVLIEDFKAAIVQIMPFSRGLVKFVRRILN
jgi:glycosyltransferase involved in cell wall biosynthesis